MLALVKTAAALFAAAFLLAHLASRDLYDYLVVATIVGGALSYVAMQVRDYRPNKRLRDDNGELRHENDRLRSDIDHLKQTNAQLEKSRDFDGAFREVVDLVHAIRRNMVDEHAKIIDAFNAHTSAEMQAWTEFTKQLSSLRGDK